MKKVLLLAVMAIFCLISCEKEDIDKPSTLPSLNGEYEYKYYTSWENGLYEDSRYISWRFDNTRKVWCYWNYWSYTNSGWSNALKKGDGDYFEWRVENNLFYKKNADNQYSTWETSSFQYINENSFVLDGITYKKIR
jgi:hypothetical protein